MKRKLVLEDGLVLEGEGFGSEEDKKLELVFNTSMVGYQEILSDPSYTDQAVVMTYPLIGNYGMCDDDYETDVPSIGGFVVREYCDEPSNFRCAGTLSEVMKRYGIVGIAGVDTRRLTRHIRDFGSCKCAFVSDGADTDKVVEELKGWEVPRDAVSRVSTKNIYEYVSDGVEKAGTGNAAAVGCGATEKPDGASKATENDSERWHVVAIDCGMKKNILREMYRKGCRITVVPWNTTAQDIKELQPDGIFISNGPGDPTDVKETIESVKALVGFRPIFGICLGHQIISLAYGARTYKLKFGHRGGNHPVRNRATGKIEITSQNHSYAVDVRSLGITRLTATHMNILDNTVEGVKCSEDMVMGIQYHPESAPGPEDSGALFDQFINLMKEWREDHA